MDGLKRFFGNFIFAFKNSYSSVNLKVILLYKVATPILQVIFYSLIAKHAYGNQNIMPYIIGNAFVLCSSCAFFGVGVVMVNERSYGTLKNIIASPSNEITIFTGKSLFYITEGFITVILGILTGVVFFNLRIEISLIPIFIMVLLVAIFSTCAMGLIIGSIGLLTRDINLLLNLATMSLMALSGVNFSISKLPILLQYISNVLPLTNSLKAAKTIVLEGTTNGVWILMGKELLICLVYCILAYALFKAMEKLSRVKATVDLY